MTKPEEHLIGHLRAARELELTTTRTLQAHIAVAPSGSYRDALRSHLRETRKHAERLEERLTELDFGQGVLQTAQAALDSLIAEIEGIGAQLLAAPMTTVAVLRRGGGEELLLEHACEACAAEAREIALYTALEQLAKQAGDDTTARLAASIRDDEERALQRLLSEIPKLARAHFNAAVRGKATYDLSSSGAADALQDVADFGERLVRRGGREARKAPGITRLQGGIRGAIGDAADLAITGYDDRTADDIVERLAGISQFELAKIEGYERRNSDRSTILQRIAALRAAEPWSGYDEMGVEEIVARLEDSSQQELEGTRSYERAHKSRVGVLRATERQLTRT